MILFCVLAHMEMPNISLRKCKRVHAHEIALMESRPQTLNPCVLVKIHPRSQRI